MFLSKDADISATFNNYFPNITKDLEIFDGADDSSDRSNIFTPISSFSNHPSIQMINYKYQNSFDFKFKLVSTDQVIKLIDEIDCNKSSSGDIPAKIIKIAKEEIAEPIRNCINSSISTGIFPDELKLADIVPVFKKEDQNDKVNYRPISLLPLISKIFENFFIRRLKIFLIRFYPKNSVDLEKDIQHNMHF